MYEITCETCGKLGFHPSRVAAESRADRHTRDVGHDCTVRAMQIE
ncbi:MAG: hypothetical protein ABEJ23_08585 [Haloarculaceae archaeon]